MTYWKRSLFFTLVLFVLLVPLLLMSRVTSKSAQASSAILGQSENMEFIGHVGGAASAIFVAGEYAYMGFGPQLAVMDITNPEQPVKVGYLVLPGLIEEVYVSRNHAYVATGEAGLRIIDISNPAAPREVAYDEAQSYGITIEQTYAYVATSSGLKILDISQPSAPSHVGTYPTATRAVSVAVMGDYAYLAAPGPNFYDGILHLVDISNPTMPLEVALYETSILLDVVVTPRLCLLSGG